MRRLLTGTLVVGGLLLVVCLMAVNGQAKVVDEPTSAMQDITTNFEQRTIGRVPWPITHIAANYVRDGHMTHKTSRVKITLGKGVVHSPNGKGLYNLWDLVLNRQGKEYGATFLAYNINNRVWRPHRTDTIKTHGIKAGQPVWIGNKSSTNASSNPIRTLPAYMVTKQYCQMVSQIKLSPHITGFEANKRIITGTGTQGGDLITAKFGNQIKKTRVDHEGRWQMKCFSGNGHLMVTETNAYDDIPGHTETVINNGTPRTDATIKLNLFLTNGHTFSTAKGRKVLVTGMILGTDQNDFDRDVVLKNNALTIHFAHADGTPIANYKANGSVNEPDKAGYFHLKLPTESLKQGPNDVKVWVSDQHGQRSNIDTLTVNVNSGLMFGQINAQMRFRSNTIPQSERLLSPTDQWQIEVHDTRSVASKWYVYATATKMKSAQHSLIGDLVYIDAAGQKHVMTNQETLVGHGTHTNPNQQTTNIAATWQARQGIFLDVQPELYAGSYHGKINWSLQDTPQS